MKILWNRLKIAYYAIMQIVFSPKCETCNIRTIMIGINLYENEDDGSHYYQTEYLCVKHPNQGSAEQVDAGLEGYA